MYFKSLAVLLCLLLAVNAQWGGYSSYYPSYGYSSYYPSYGYSNYGNYGYGGYRFHL